MEQKFKEIYNKNHSFFARAPGRVNLIGEHIDYMGKCFNLRIRSLTFCNRK